ncbi:unnamed protein product [Ostreobium quekettii]|uniref:J domain-containing protein n=1 Tax=Ostreobium quekettii TaxID=121088 RepID=A0A8S1ITU4_9CHLO|nr:unnamed protein product [Ostreobium quekettii]
MQANAERLAIFSSREKHPILCVCVCGGVWVGYMVLAACMLPCLGLPCKDCFMMIEGCCLFQPSPYFCCRRGEFDARSAGLALRHFRHVAASESAREKAAARFKAVSEAYRVLSNERERAIYDVSGRSAVYRSRTGERTRASASYARTDQKWRTYSRAGSARGFDRRQWSAFLLRVGTQLPFQALIATGILLGALTVGSTAEGIWNHLNRGKQFADVIKQTKRATEPERLSTRNTGRMKEASEQVGQPDS